VAWQIFVDTSITLLPSSSESKSKDTHITCRQKQHELPDVGKHFSERMDGITYEKTEISAISVIV
jgi:hypothetical protein